MKGCYVQKSAMGSPMYEEMGSPSVAYKPTYKVGPGCEKSCAWVTIWTGTRKIRADVRAEQRLRGSRISSGTLARAAMAGVPTERPHITPFHEIGLVSVK